MFSLKIVWITALLLPLVGLLSEQRRAREHDDARRPKLGEPRPSRELASALLAFTENRSVNLLKAAESLESLVHLTAELSVALGAVGGGPSTIDQLVSAAAAATEDAQQPNLHAIVAQAVEAVCATCVYCGSSCLSPRRLSLALS